MGLILTASILGAIYLLKIFFPEFVIEVAQVESITRIGHYIDAHKWAWYLASFAISFLSYYLLMGACCEKRIIAYKEIFSIVVTIIILLVVRELLPAKYTVLNYCSMLILPMVYGGKFKNTVIWFSSTLFLQSITLEIRNKGLMVADFNFATGLILLIDFYILEALLYFMFNYKEGE